MSSMVSFYNNENGKRNTLKNFLSACSKDGRLTYLGLEFLPPTGVLGLEQAPITSTWSFEDPWWEAIAKVIRSCNETIQLIFWCLHYKRGWCQYEYNNWRSKLKIVRQLWYTLKCVVCLIFLQWHRPANDHKHFHSVEVTAYDFGQVYDGTSWFALEVGEGVFRNWYTHSYTDSSS